MGLISLDFLLLTAITFIIYWMFPNRYRKHVIVFSSVIFCASYGLKTLLFTLSYVLISYVLGKYIQNKKVLIVSIIVVLLPLLSSKYILENSISIIGLSFVTFRAISYIVDKYRKEIANDNLVDYSLYLLFFPTLLSGPIEKSKDFLLEINENKSIEWHEFVEAIIIICYGLIMKLIIADNISLIINAIYDNNSEYTLYCIFAVLAYPIYIYCDFAGYSYIAYGTAKFFGYNVTLNFKQPYFSTSIKEFWNRWHVSLNKWFINYVYIPLGGNRKGKFKYYLNILIVFALSGIWHGTGLGFIIWGLLNAIYQIIGSLTLNFRDSVYKKIRLNGTFIQKVIRTIATYLLIAFTWIFFAQGFSGGIKIVGSLFEKRKMGLMQFMLDVCGKAKSSKIAIFILFVFVVIMVVVDYLNSKKYNIANTISKKNIIIRYVVVLVLIIFIVLFGKYGGEYNPNNFIYYDF